MKPPDTIGHWLRWGMQVLAEHSDEPLFDIEQILIDTLAVSRVWLHAHSEQVLPASLNSQVHSAVRRRCAGEPLAYVLGQWTFLQQTFLVDRHTLVPRTETETLLVAIERCCGDKSHLWCADLGTGSGVVGLSIAMRWPQWQVWLTDRSLEALRVARRNAQRLGCWGVGWSWGRWCLALPHRHWDLLVSNPPYLARDDLHLKQLQREPQQALVSGADGLTAIRTLVLQSRSHLRPGGWLLLEHGHTQASQVATYLSQAGFQQIETLHDQAGCPRVTLGARAAAV